MLTLNDSALVMSLVAVWLALRGWPRLSLAMSVGGAWYSIWGWRWRRWERRAEAEGD
jgi:hypothetical protein